MPADAANVEARRATMLRRWWAVAGLTLFAATWKLWTPQTEFPQVPLFGWAGSLPAFTDWLAFGVLLGSLVFAVWRSDSRRSWLTFIVSLSVSIVLDQHRLQPWVWQLFLMAIYWRSANVEQVFNLPGPFQGRQVENLPHVLLTISIYFWSSVSKLDPTFFATHGQTLVEALFQAVGIDATPWPARGKWWLALALPLGELLVAVGLCWPRTRRVALYSAIVLHIGLILTLGPTGLGHRPGVLLWNLAFIGHDWLLFGARPFVSDTLAQSVSEGTTSPVLHTPSLAVRVRVFVIGFACVWPITERWGLCDRWLAWSVYSARSERVGVTLTEEGRQRLPRSARTLASDGELWLDRWSLTALDAPIYPQSRFQFGVVEWLRQRCGDENLVEVIVQHSQGESGLTERLTVEQCEEQRRAFWINARPRGCRTAIPTRRPVVRSLVDRLIP